ncbi:MAG: hypothetical protein WA609_07310 [Terriglobales bacterium]
MRWARLGGSFIVSALAGAGLLLSAGTVFAQRGGAGLGGGAPVAGVGAPTGVDEKDDLQGFHRALAVQATSGQIAEFQEVVRKTEAARRGLEELVNGLDSNAPAKSGDEWAARAVAVRQAVDVARTGTGRFVNEFSVAQKAGLRETVAKLVKAESELGEQEKLLDAPYEAGRIAGGADGIRKAMGNFRSAQDDLAVEMGIVVSEGSPQVAFNIPVRKSSRTIAGQAVAITTSGVITRVAESAAPGAEGVYKVEATTDLADLQANFGAILRATMNKEDQCGERIRVKEADLSPEIPTGSALVRLHYERWLCSPGYGGNREMTEGNATIDMRLTARMGPDGRVQISSQIEQVEAERFLTDLLNSGTLGDELKEKMSAAVTSAVANLKNIVPVGGDAVSARSVRFASPREGELSVVVGGVLRMSEAQAKEMERLATAGTVAERSK